MKPPLSPARLRLLSPGVWLGAMLLVGSEKGAAADTMRAMDRTEGRALSYTLNGVPSPSYEVRTDVTGQIDLRWHQGSLQTTYGPHFTFRDMNGSSSRDVLQVATATLSLNYRQSTLRLTEEASYGDNNFAALALGGATQQAQAAGAGGTATAAPTTPTPGAASPSSTPVAQSLIANPSTLHYGSTSTQINWTSVLSRIWSYNLRGLYSVNGGTDSGSQSMLRLQRVETADAELTSKLGRSDTYVGSLSVSDTWFGAAAGIPSQQYLFVTATQGLRHRWSRITQLSGLLGVVGVRGGPQEDPSALSQIYPLLDFSCSSTLSRKLHRYDLLAHARFSPEANRLLGTVDGRAQFELGAGWQYGDLSLRTGLTEVASVPATTPGGIFQLAANFTVGYRINAIVLVEGGAQVMNQRMQAAQGYAGMDSRIAAGFVAVTVGTPDLRF